MTFVPYSGVAPAVNALLGGHVSSAFSTYSTVSEQMNAGRLRALATGSPTRIGPLPEAPTVAESGYPDYEVDVWIGLWAPAKTPKEAVSQLAGWFATALQTLKLKLVAQGLFPSGYVPAGSLGIFARNATNTAAPSARQTSRQSETGRSASGQAAKNSKRAKLVGSATESGPIVDRCGLFSLGPPTQVALLARQAVTRLDN
jgi:Tripartite tricarboxylate transporter family receptor